MLFSGQSQVLPRETGQSPETCLSTQGSSTLTPVQGKIRQCEALLNPEPLYPPPPGRGMSRQLQNLPGYT